MDVGIEDSIVKIIIKNNLEQNLNCLFLEDLLFVEVIKDVYKDI